MRASEQTVLAAIVHGDVVGFSRHIAEDEEGTIAWLTRLRPRLADLASAHDGSLVDAKGDDFLARFGTALDAVRFGLAVQEAVREMDPADTSPGARAGPRERRIRLGVHLGDVRLVGDSVYGNGVNIAARLQALAPAGGLCFSSAIYEQVKGRIPLDANDMGEPQLKNIPHPVRAYRVPSPEAPTDEMRAQKTSGATAPGAIAVLPFENLGDDPGQEYFADGIVEDLITRLAVLRYFPVIARNSTFVYRRSAVDVRQVGRELGARYVVEGSVRRSGDRVRVVAQLVEAESGHHVWAERYDRELHDVFELQDELVADICTAIEPALRRFEPERSLRKPPERLDAWERSNCGLWHLQPRTENETALALEHFTAALELDPLCVRAHMGRAVALMWRRSFGWRSEPGDLEDALASARRAVELDPQDAFACFTVGDILQSLGRLEEATRHHELAVEMNPVFSMARWGLGRSRVLAGRYDDAIAELERAIRFSPRDPMLPSFLSSLAQAYFGAGRYEESLDACKRSLLDQENGVVLCLAAASCHHLGKTDEGRVFIERAKRAAPALSVAFVEAWLEQRNIQSDYRRRVLEGVTAAGLA